MLKRVFIALLISFLSFVASAQLSSIPENLGNIRSADITDQQISQAVEQLRQNNLTANQAYQILLRRGMAVNEATLLKSRIENALGSTATGSTPTYDDAPSSRRGSSTSPSTTSASTATSTAASGPINSAVANPLRIFGLEIFSNGMLSYQPDLSIATPLNYIIGPGDQISISIYGYQEAKYNLTVSPEGDINIPLVGIVFVSGLTFDQATAKIRNKLATNGYANIRTGLTKVNVSLGKIRSITVTILGEVRKPGTYTLSSLSTVFNALNLSAGPNDIGSLRLIEIIRNGKVIDRLDVYDFLVKGDQSGNIRLNDQDIIRIPPYKARVSMQGEVKRPGLFEVVPGENLEKVLDFAGGFTDRAYTASIKVYRATDTEKQIFDVSKDNFKTYMPARAETFVVRRLVDRVTNRVVIRGAVYLPGDYQLTEGMTLAELIRKAGLREDAFRERGLIIRYNENLTTELVQFNPAAVLTGNQSNIALKRNDQVTISSVFDIKETFSVTVSGEVRRPGSFTYTPSITLKDVILLAGGFTEAAAPRRIEIARRIKKDSIDINDTEIAQVIDVSSVAELSTVGSDIKLQPWDVIQVRTSPGYHPQVNASITGEVLYPGSYALRSRDERVSDLLARAGGITRQAYKKGAFITRLNKSTTLKDLALRKVEKIQREAKDTSNAILDDITAPTVKIAVNLDEIIKNPRSDIDLTIQEGDVLNIPQEVFEVKVNGEVMFPTQIVYKEGEDLLYYIDKAGGFTDDAQEKKTYVLYGNGNASKTKKFLFVKNFPKIEPGAEILVPKISERKRARLSTGEVVAITSGVASLVGVVVALLNFLK